MSEHINATTRTNVENNVVLISKIYESFEALEETLGKLNTVQIGSVFILSA